MPDFTVPCALCGDPIRDAGHELCLPCVKALGWSPSRFGYRPTDAHPKSEAK